jgi:tetraacyldisaccharide 4'-kinase
LIHALSAAYGRAALWRRRWYAHDPARVRCLTRPVVSIGNLRVGGTGKTPIAALVAALLRDAGERPAILTRGYHREQESAGVTVVSDGRSPLEPVERAGDEPLLLARALSGVPVLVSRDRYLAGRMAETRFGATVHVLDDGFQHFELRRTVDLLLAGEDDLVQAVVPAGELREPLRAAAVADALLATTDTAGAADRLARALGIPTVFRVTRALDAPRDIHTAERILVPASAPVFVAAGIARPERFVADVISNGWQVAGTMTFRDHHPFSDADVERIEAAARAAGAAIVFTTEKDAVRLERRRFDLTCAAVPLRSRVEPDGAFRDWLLGRLRR